MQNITDVPTCQLVNELRRREGVEVTVAEPCQNLTFTASGPAVILLVTD